MIASRAESVSKSGAVGGSGLRSWMILAVLCTAQLMLIVDVVVVNVALPSIRDSLGVGDGRLQLISVAYTLVFGSLLIVSGRAGDILGRRRLLLAGIAIFTGASALAGVTGSEWQLFAARALQGLGAALISPNALALLTATFADGEPRNRALGFWGAVGSGGAILGQLLGGALTSLAGWRWVFLINLPVGLLALLFVTLFLVDPAPRLKRQMDLAGAVTLTTGFAALALTLLRLGEQRFDLIFWGATGFTGLLLLSFVLIERRKSEPLIEVRLLRNGSVLSGNIVLALNAGALVGVLFYTTLYLQVVLDYSPAQVGLGFAPVTGIVLLVSPFAGRLVGRLGARTLLISGGLLVAAGMAYLTQASITGSYFATVLPALAAIALGSGLAFAPAYVAGTSGVDEREHGSAAGLLATSQELGSAIGLAVVACLATVVAGSTAAFEGPQPLDVYRAAFAAALLLQLVSILVAVRMSAARSEERSGE